MKSHKEMGKKKKNTLALMGAKRGAGGKGNMPRGGNRWKKASNPEKTAEIAVAFPVVDGGTHGGGSKAMERPLLEQRTSRAKHEGMIQNTWHRLLEVRPDIYRAVGRREARG